MFVLEFGFDKNPPIVAISAVRGPAGIFRAVRWGAMAPPSMSIRSRPPTPLGGADGEPADAGPPTALKTPAFHAGIQAGLEALRAKQAAMGKRPAKDASAEEAEARGHSRW